MYVHLLNLTDDGERREYSGESRLCLNRGQNGALAEKHLWQRDPRQFPGCSCPQMVLA